MAVAVPVEAAPSTSDDPLSRLAESPAVKWYLRKLDAAPLVTKQFTSVRRPAPNAIVCRARELLLICRYVSHMCVPRRGLTLARPALTPAVPRAAERVCPRGHRSAVLDRA